LAGRQHGVVSAVQLGGLGLSGAAIRRWTVSGRLHRLHRGVYAVGHPSLTGHGRWLAAVLACGPAALLSHASAAALWGLRPTSRALIDVTAASATKRSGLTVHRARHLSDDDRSERHGIPVTAIPRTLLDLAAVLPARSVARAWEEADRLRLLDVRAMRATSARTPGHHGLPTLLSLMARTIRLTHRRLVDEPHAVVGELRALLGSRRSQKGLVDLSVKD